VRRIPRKTLATAGALVFAVGVAGNASADGVTDQLSQVTGSINSPLQDDTQKGKANLFTQVTTIDQNNSPVIAAFPPEVVRIDFPNDMKYTANKFLKKCNPANIGGNPASAVAACRASLVGGGIAMARIPGVPLPNNEVKLTVTTFNGPTSVEGQQDSDDVPTGGFIGGNPTILLHASNPSLPVVLTQGEIIPSPNGADFGKQLFVPNAPDVADDAGALTMFNSQVAKTYTNGKSGSKKKTYQMISSSCDGGDLDFAASWTYDDDTTDVDTVQQDCVQK
jgi:hypothetical protein